jgi:hypothetical protein
MIEGRSGLVAMGFEHEFKGRAEALAAFVEVSAMRERAGDFLDPPHEASVKIGLDDGVVTLLHDSIVGKRRL